MESDDTDEYQAFLTSFGLNLRRLRTAKHPYISQERLALDTGLHRTAVGKIERGMVEPHVTTIMRIARHLHVSLDEMVAGLDVPTARRPPARRKPPTI